MALSRNHRSPFTRVFDDFFGDFQVGFPEDNSLARIPSLALDIKEDEGNFTVTADVPGMDKNEISISCQNGMLNINASRDETKEEEGERFHKKERRFGSVQRSIRLPENTNVQDINADLNNGVLVITIPKVESTDDDVHHVQIK